MTATLPVRLPAVSPDAPVEPLAPAAPVSGATRAERAAAIGLWAVTGAALAFGMVATLVKAAGLFAG